MAEFFSPNYVNEQYATPEQLARQRAYSEALMKRSGEPVNRPAGAFGNMIDALTGRIEANRANELQSQAAANNAARIGALISQQQSGKLPSAANLAQIYADPMASPETRALVSHLLTPQKVEDVMGRPGYAGPAQGVNAAPIKGNFQPGFRAPEAAGSVSTTTPIVAPMEPRRVQSVPVKPSTPGAGGVFGGMGKPVGWDDNSMTPAPQGGAGPRAPGAVPPGSPAPAATGGSRIDELAAKDRELSAAKTFTQGGAESITGVQKEDVAAAMNAPNIKTVAGVMLDDLRAHGDKMTFGPTADWSNRVKKIAANYAAGPMKSQLEAIASADSFDKMSAQLASMLSRGGGTDAQLFNNIKSVPGAHNSKEGAEALLKMVIQVADQQQGLREYVSRARDAYEYEYLRKRYFELNPIINPITGNPIARDFQNRATAPGAGGGARIISVEPAR